MSSCRSFYSNIFQKMKSKTRLVGPRARVRERVGYSQKVESIVRFPAELSSLDISTSAQDLIIENITTKQDDRKRMEIAMKLNKIHDRIEVILQSAGVRPNIHPTMSEHEVIQFSLSRPPFYDNREADRSQFAYQRAVLEMINNFASSCEERGVIMKDTVEWFASATDIIGTVKHSDEMKKQEQRYSKMYKAISEAYENAKTAGEKIEKIGYKLLEDAGYLLEEDEDEDDAITTKKVEKGKQPLQVIDVFEEDALIEDVQTWLEAANEVKRVLGESIRQVKTNQAKAMVRSAFKQYKFVVSAMEQRLAGAVQKDEELVDLQVESHKMNNANEKLKKEVQQITGKCDRVEMQLNKMTKDWEHEMKTRKEAQKEIISLNEQKEDLEILIEEMESTRSKRPSIVTFIEEPPVVTTPPPLKTVRTQSSSRIQPQQQSSSHVEKEVIQIQEDSVLKEAVSKLNSEIENYKIQLEEKEKQYKDLEKTYKRNLAIINRLENKVKEIEEIEQVFNIKEDRSIFTMEEDNKKIKAKLFSLSKQKDKLLEEVETLKEHVTTKDELVQYQEKQLTELMAMTAMMGAQAAEKTKTKVKVVKNESKVNHTTGPDPKLMSKIEDLKRTISRLKKEHENEISRLKDHLEREKQRNEATVRRIENVHKDQLLNIHKNSLHMLRAINRFKEAVGEVLEREYLLDAAHDVSNMDDLPIDDAPADPRSVLVQMAGNAVELLVALEFKLSQALMNRRLELKDKNTAKQFAAKDLEIQMEYTKKIKKENELLSEKVRIVRDALAATEEALREVRKIENARYAALLERYKQSWHQNRSLIREAENLREDFAETVKQKENAYKLLMASKQELFNQVQSQQVAIKSLKLDFKHKRELTEKNYQLSVKDMKKNLGTLQAALKGKRISHQLYDMTAEIMKKAMEIPALRLRQLMTTYIAYKKLQTNKARLKIMIQENADSEKVHELRLHLDKMDFRIENALYQWNSRKENLSCGQRQMFGKMAKLFDDVVTETGILLILPTKLESPIQSPSPIFPTFGTDSLRHGVTLRPLEMTEALIGQRVPYRGEASFWQVPLPSVCNMDRVAPKIEIPKIVDLEVNSYRRNVMRSVGLAVTKNKSLRMPSAKGYEYKGYLKPLQKPLQQTNSAISLGTVNIPS